MTFNEAIEIIREKDKSLYEYYSNHADGFTNLNLINYAKYLEELEK